MCNLVMYVYIYVIHDYPQVSDFSKSFFPPPAGAVWLTRLTTSLLYLADNESLGLEHLNEASQLMEFPVKSPTFQRRNEQ